MLHRNALVAAARAAFALSLTGHAGPPAVVYTAHELSLTLKPVSQGEASNGDDKADKTTINAKDVLETCLERTPAKDEAIFLFIPCEDLNANEIIAIDKLPVVDGLESLGHVALDLDNAMRTEKNGVLKSALVPAEVTLSCNSDEEHLTASGIMEIKFSAVGEGGPICPESAKLKLTGTGFSTTGPGRFLVNDGSSLTAKKRSSTISTPPDL